MYKRILASLIVLIIASILAEAASAVIKHPDPSRPLSERWKWALEHKGARVVVWSFEREMPENELIGSFYSDRSRYPTLRELLSGESSANPVLSVRDEAQRALDGLEQKPEATTLVRREIGIFIELSEEDRVNSAEISMLDMPYRPKNRPVLWLGKTGAEESLSFVQQLYAQNSSVKIREELIPAVALHELHRITLPFLERILLEEKEEDLREGASFWLAQSGDKTALQKLLTLLPRERSQAVIDSAFAGMNDHEEALTYYRQLAPHGNPRILREQAIFWMGQTERPEAAQFLQELIHSDVDIEMRKKAVFSLSQMPELLSLKPLIAVARDDESEDIRKEAVFCLSQIASERVAGVLKERVENDRSIEVQKHALFALAELDDEEAVTELIRVAKSHPNMSLRKEAIFWLGEIDDPRAREALLKMLED